MPFVNAALALFLLLLVVATFVRWVRSYRLPEGEQFRRRLYGTFAISSSLICILVAIFWVRSYFVFDCYTRPYISTISAFHLISNRGVISFGEVYAEGHWLGATTEWTSSDGHTNRIPSHAMVATQEGWSTSNPRPLHFSTPSFFGIRVESVAEDMGQDYFVGWIVRVPHFWLVYAFAGIPIIWCKALLRRRRAKRRIDNLQCVACGFDLRATNHDTCPECGQKRGQWTV